MNSSTKEVLVFLGFMIAVILVVGFIGIYQEREEERVRTEAYDKGYKDACVDVYKGTLKMKLVEQEDGSIIWKKVKKEQTSVDADHRKQRGKTRPK